MRRVQKTPKTTSLSRCRGDFPIFKTHPRLAYLDSAATTQKPQAVIDAITSHYRAANANIHRGVYGLSQQASAAYDNARATVATFINAPSPRNIIFVRNATEAINLVAYAWARANLKKGDEVLTTLMEHHANIVPWHVLAEERGVRVRFAGVTRSGVLDLRDLQTKRTPRTKLVTLTHASNVLGTINHIARVTALCHKKGIPVLVDGAQAAPHFPVDVQKLGCDFYAFSGHKMLAPTGIGVLYASDAMLETMQPFLTGGDMIRSVTQKGATYQDAPQRFEAGTPAIEAAVGLAAAISYLQTLGMARVRKHEIALTAYALKELAKIPGVTVYGPKNAKNRTGVITFTVKGMHAHDLASLFDAAGIAIRAGHHCAMPLHTDVLGGEATARMSFYVYTTKEDIRRVITVLKRITANA